jgi:hypothetical protein
MSIDRRDWLAGLLLGAALGKGSAQPRSNAAVPPAPGQGPGYHDPRSAFKPLEEREGVLSWNLLSAVTTRVEKKKIVPQFPAPVEALHQQKVKVQGWMLPLEPGDRQEHFLLSAVPTTCNFCTPAGPEGLIEVRTGAPVRYTLEAITIEGLLAVLKDDPYGLYYRVVEGQLVGN